MYLRTSLLINSCLGNTRKNVQFANLQGRVTSSTLSYRPESIRIAFCVSLMKFCN